jgi:CheY-like chemotaxis protein
MHFASSGQQALHLLTGEIQPELIVILSDINMPGMDGLQLIGEIKQRRPDLPVMMVTHMATTTEDAAPVNSAFPNSSQSQ